MPGRANFISPLDYIVRTKDTLGNVKVRRYSMIFGKEMRRQLPCARSCDVTNGPRNTCPSLRRFHSVMLNRFFKTSGVYFLTGMGN